MGSRHDVGEPARLHLEAVADGDVNTPPPVALAEGTAEALKWFAAILMVLDHANKYLFAEEFTGLFDVDRIVMPIFGFVLAHNLARPGIVTSGAIHRMMMRLGFVGLLSSPLVIYLNAHAGGQPPWWPLNIFFTLGLVVALVALKDKRGMRWGIAKLLLFLAGGALVEYLWFGIAVCLTAYAYCRRPSRGRLLGWITATASLGLVNQNGWALASIPLILIAIELPLAVPRLRWAFYALYPLHLLVLAGIDWAGA